MKITRPFIAVKDVTVAAASTVNESISTKVTNHRAYRLAKKNLKAEMTAEGMDLLERQKVTEAREELLRAQTKAAAKAAKEQARLEALAAEARVTVS